MLSSSRHNSLDLASIGSQTEGLTKPSAPLNDSANDKEACQNTQLMLQTMRKDSRFFERNPNLKLPKFEPHEISFDQNIGQGQFGTVFTIGCIQSSMRSSKFASYKRNSFRDSITHAPTVTTHEEIETEDDSLSIISSDEPSFVQIQLDLKQMHTFSSGRNHHPHHHNEGSKDYMSTHIFRDGQPRYAVKQLRADLKGETLVKATKALACEATFLTSLRHPNICTMRATIGEPGSRSFGIVMDRLVMTLEAKMMDWKRYERCKYRLLKKVLRQRQPSKEEQREVQTQIYGEKLMAFYDIALALKHLADNRIIFRNLEPSNAGFDVHGALRLFDFGKAKELKDQDMTTPDGLYRLTAMTGSHMAPEVSQSKEYGLSADIYSLGLLMWQVLSNSLTLAKSNKRPNLKKMITNEQVLPHGARIHELVDLCLFYEPQNRPTIDTVCEKVHGEILLYTGGWF